MQREILKIQLGTKPLTANDMESLRKILSRLESDLNERIRRIPAQGIPEMGFTPQTQETQGPYDAPAGDASAKPTEKEMKLLFDGIARGDMTSAECKYYGNARIAFHKWSRILLSLLIDKAYCVAYQPFLKNIHSKLWSHARGCALKHCFRFMRKFVQLATDPAFQPFQWSWPGYHQPMHAAM